MSGQHWSVLRSQHPEPSPGSFYTLQIHLGQVYIVRFVQGQVKGGSKYLDDSFSSSLVVALSGKHACVLYVIREMGQGLVR